MKINCFLIFDFDSTIIKLESLEEIAFFALQHNENRDAILEEITNITNLGMEGKIDFKESLKKRLSLFNVKKHHIELANQKIMDHITPSFLRNIDFIKKNADKIYIISGGFVSNIQPIAQFFGIATDHILANEFVFDDDIVSGVDETSAILLPQGKSCAVSNLKLDGDIIVIGDGYTDYQIKETGSCQHFIAFCENIRRESVVQKADFVANNLDDIIRLLPGLSEHVTPL